MSFVRHEMGHYDNFSLTKGTFVPPIVVSSIPYDLVAIICIPIFILIHYGMSR